MQMVLFKNQLRNKPTDSHDLTFRTFITASSHLHFKKTVCSILRNKLTKNFRSFCILNLRLQRQDQHVKDVNFSCITKKEQYFHCTRHASENWLTNLRKTLFTVQRPSYLEDYYPYSTAGRITRSLFGHARRYPRHTPRSKERIFLEGVVSHPMLMLISKQRTSKRRVC